MILFEDVCSAISNFDLLWSRRGMDYELALELLSGTDFIDLGSMFYRAFFSVNLSEAMLCSRCIQTRLKLSYSLPKIHNGSPLEA